jgi:acyl-coenzyme A thioesterase PaaI-like protein
MSAGPIDLNINFLSPVEVGRVLSGMKRRGSS